MDIDLGARPELKRFSNQLKRFRRLQMQIRSRMLLLRVATLFFSSSMVFAQTPPPPTPTDKQPPVAEEITVTALGESLREAIKVKEESDQIVDALAAKDVNKLPDKNV